MAAREERILHIPRVLYHWRCHEASTAANPHSKKYAYEAGCVHCRIMRRNGDPGKGRGDQTCRILSVTIYRGITGETGCGCRRWQSAVWEKPRRITGGRMTADGKVFYEGLPKDFGGYLHRAELSQDAEALDLRCIRIRSADRELFEKSWSAFIRK